jgi:glutathione S-transferase
VAEYTLYCFAQSGNAYKPALTLQLAGADWAPRFVDYFNRRGAHAGVSRDQRDGRGAGFVAS